MIASPAAQYCYRCCKWCSTLDDWKEHCEWHLQNLSTRCEIYTYRHTLLAPGICPFCVGGCEFAPAKRFYQWTSSIRLWQHVDVHLKWVSWPMSCPHPLCKVTIGDRELFDYHLVDTHGKHSSAKETLKRKREKAMSRVCREKKRLDTSMRSCRGEDVFLNNYTARKMDDAFADAVRSMTDKFEGPTDPPHTPPSLAMKTRSNSCPPISGTHSALALRKPDIVQHTQSATLTSATSSESPTSQATTISYCGVEYEVNNGSKSSETQTSSAISSESPPAQATTIPYCGVDYAFNDGLEDSELDPSGCEDNYNAIDDVPFDDFLQFGV